MRTLPTPLTQRAAAATFFNFLIFLFAFATNQRAPRFDKILAVKQPNIHFCTLKWEQCVKKIWNWFKLQFCKYFSASIYFSQKLDPAEIYTKSSGLLRFTNRPSSMGIKIYFMIILLLNKKKISNIFLWKCLWKQIKLTHFLLECKNVIAFAKIRNLTRPFRQLRAACSCGGGA